MPARMLLMTSPDGSQAPQERIRIDNVGIVTLSGVLRLATTTNSSPQNGDIWFDGTNIKKRVGGATTNIET